MAKTKKTNRHIIVEKTQPTYKTKQHEHNFKGHIRLLAFRIGQSSKISHLWKSEETPNHDSMHMAIVIICTNAMCNIMHF